MNATRMSLFLTVLLFVISLHQIVSLKPDLSKRASLRDWKLDGSGSWDISKGKLVLTKAGIPSGNIRRPAALAILNSDPLHNFTLEAQVRSTAPTDVLRRDLDLIFGYESPSRFYYVHLSGAADAVHNGIFLVADADRRRIDSGDAKPLLTDQEWHKVRLVRDGTTGKIDVYMDDSANSVLSASDQTIRAGRVGLGSFDDTGEFRAIIVKGSAK